MYTRTRAHARAGTHTRSGRLERVGANAALPQVKRCLTSGQVKRCLTSGQAKRCLTSGQAKRCLTSGHARSGRLERVGDDGGDDLRRRNC